MVFSGYVVFKINLTLEGTPGYDWYPSYYVGDNSEKISGFDYLTTVFSFWGGLIMGAILTRKK